MAKKPISTLKDKSKLKYIKFIKAVRSPKTGHYTFNSEILPQDKADKLLAEFSKKT